MRSMVCPSLSIVLEAGVLNSSRGCLIRPWGEKFADVLVETETENCLPFQIQRIVDDDAQFVPFHAKRRMRCLSIQLSGIRLTALGGTELYPRSMYSICSVQRVPCRHGPRWPRLDCISASRAELFLIGKVQRLAF